MQLWYKTTAAFPRGKLLARRSADVVAAQVATLFPSQGTLAGNVDKGKMERKNHVKNVKIRLTEDEFSRVMALKESGGFPTVSSYLRAAITRKKMTPKLWKKGVDDAEFRKKINRLVYEVNKVGVNYNQVVATVQKQSRQTRSDGTPYLTARGIEGAMLELRRHTEALRDEFAVFLSFFRDYLGETPEQ